MKWGWTRNAWAKSRHTNAISRSLPEKLAANTLVTVYSCLKNKFRGMYASQRSVFYADIQNSRHRKWLLTRIHHGRWLNVWTNDWWIDWWMRWDIPSVSCWCSSTLRVMDDHCYCEQSSCWVQSSPWEKWVVVSCNVIDFTVFQLTTPTTSIINHRPSTQQSTVIQWRPSLLIWPLSLIFLFTSFSSVLKSVRVRVLKCESYH